MHAIVGERQETTSAIDNDFARVQDFTYLQLKDNFKAHPKDFVDVLGDGGIVYKVRTRTVDDLSLTIRRSRKERAMPRRLPLSASPFA